MELYVNKSSKAGYYVLYIAAVSLMLSGIFTIFGDFGPAHFGVSDGILFLSLGIGIFTTAEWVYRRLVQRIEFLNDRFRITTMSITGVHVHEGKLQYCEKFEKFQEFFKVEGKSYQEGVAYIMEYVNKRFIMSFSKYSVECKKLDRVIHRLSKQKNGKLKLAA